MYNSTHPLARQPLVSSAALQVPRSLSRHAHGRVHMKLIPLIDTKKYLSSTLRGIDLQLYHGKGKL